MDLANSILTRIKTYSGGEFLVITVVFLLAELYIILMAKIVGFL
jgi:hypothetical protein